MKLLEFQFSEWGHLGWWVPAVRIGFMDFYRTEFLKEPTLFPIGIGYFIPTERFVFMPFIERNGFKIDDPTNIDHLIVEAGLDVALRLHARELTAPVNLRIGFNFINGEVYPMIGGSVFFNASSWGENRHENFRKSAKTQAVFGLPVALGMLILTGL